MTVQEITKLAEARWEQCHGCDDNDKNFWMNGFITGYLMAENESLEVQIKREKEVLNKLKEITNEPN
jgi:hypothetical protein